MKIYILPLNIKLGLNENFVKATDQNNVLVMYMKNHFPRKSDANIKKGHLLDLK